MMAKVATGDSSSGRAAHFGAIDVALLAMTVIWGLNAVVVKAIFVQMPPQVFMAVRFALAGALLLAVAYGVERSLAIRRRDLLLLLAAAMVGTGFYQPIFLYGLSLTSASNAVLIIAISPVFVALINHVLGRETLSPRAWAGIGLALAGVVLIVEGGAAGLHFDLQGLQGDALVLLSTFLWALYAVVAAPLVRVYTPLRVTALTTAIGALPLMLLGAPAVYAMDWTQVNGWGWAGLVYSAVFAIVVAYVIWNMGVQRIGGARTALYANLIPVVGAAAAAIFLNEPLTVLKVTGAAIIFAGLHLARTARAS
jgi:drug/metabolite transporter (DMT)-like permease